MVQKQNEQLFNEELIFRAFLNFTHPTAQLLQKQENINFMHIKQPFNHLHPIQNLSQCTNQRLPALTKLPKSRLNLSHLATLNRGLKHIKHLRPIFIFSASRSPKSHIQCHCLFLCHFGRCCIALGIFKFV